MIDGIVVFVSQIGIWCSVVVFEDEEGTKVVVVLSVDGELHVVDCDYLFVVVL